MRVTHLSLSHFRNYRAAEVEFAPGINLILGRNGQGKTNLVEAIAYFATLGSHRVTAEGALIRAGAESAIARMRIAVSSRDALLEIQLNRGQANRAQINRNPVKPRELLRWFSAVMFAPEDLSIVRGEPALRRRFLDEAVVARNPALSGVLADYDRVVRQRSSLLKSTRLTGNKSAVEATLSVWDEQLIEFGSRIMFERHRLVAELAPFLAASYFALVGVDHAPGMTLSETALGPVPRSDVSRETVSRAGGSFSTLADVSRETIVADFTRALAEARKQEIERGVTLVGPHRDELILTLNELPVRGYASHGESWSFVLSLRLALAQLLRAESPAGDPVIILDDVFAELDSGRRQHLMDAVGQFEQVIVTAAVEEDIPAGLSAHRIHVSEGAVVDAGPPMVNGGARDVGAR